MIVNYLMEFLRWFFGVFIVGGAFFGWVALVYMFREYYLNDDDLDDN